MGAQYAVSEEHRHILTRVKQKQPLVLEKQLTTCRLLFLLSAMYSCITPGIPFSLPLVNLSKLCKQRIKIRAPQCPRHFWFCVCYSSLYLSLTVLLQPRERDSHTFHRNSFWIILVAVRRLIVFSIPTNTQHEQTGFQQYCLLYSCYEALDLCMLSKRFCKKETKII